MHPRGPIWHVSFLALWGALSIAGCYDMHDYALDAAAPALPDVSFPPDTIAPLVDAGLLDAGDRCAIYFDELARGVAPELLGCDGRTFPRDCVRTVGECCQASLECAIAPGDGGHVVLTVACDDWCDQSCGALPLSDCGLFSYCEPFAPGACGPAPPGVVEGPACIQRRAGPCDTDPDCSEGLRCRTYWIDPCAGLGCAACGGEERRCAP